MAECLLFKHAQSHTHMHARKHAACMHIHIHTLTHTHTHTHFFFFYHYQQHDQHQTLKTNQKQTISMQSVLVHGRSWFTLLAISKTTSLNINKINTITTSLHSGKNKLRSETAQLVYTALLKQASNFYLEIKLHGIQFNHNLSQLC